MLTTVLPQSIHQTLSGSSDSITLMSLGIGLLYPFLRSWRPKASHYARLAGAVRCIRKTGVVAEQYLQVFVRLNQSSAVHAGSLRPATRIRPENGSSIPSSIGWRRTCGCFWAGITYLTSACTTRAASEWGCLMCPMASAKHRLWEAARYPLFTATFIRSFERLYAYRKSIGAKSVNRWGSGKEMFFLVAHGKERRSKDRGT